MHGTSYIAISEVAGMRCEIVVRNMVVGELRLAPGFGLKRYSHRFSHSAP